MIEVPKSCQGCGACCRFDWMQLEPGDVVPAQFMGEHEGQAVMVGLMPEWRCPALDATRNCAIYDQRPACCSRFVRGGEGCLRALRLAESFPMERP